METTNEVVAMGLFLLVFVVVAATVPLWVPALWRWFREDDLWLKAAEIERWERELDRQWLDYQTSVQQAAQRRGLDDQHWPALSTAMERWWGSYRDGRISWAVALCEAEAWISRRVRQNGTAAIHSATSAGGAA